MAYPISHFEKLIPYSKRKDFENYLKGYKCKYEYNRTFIYHWRERLLCQCRASSNTHWITLTFDEQHIARFMTRQEIESLGITDYDAACNIKGMHLVDNHDDDDNLSKLYYNRCFDLFIRRLRISLERSLPLESKQDIAKLKFFAATETGDLFGRFHFHMLLWNVPECVSSAAFTQLLFDKWSYGFVTDEILFDYGQKVNYITKYLFKRFEDKLTFTRKSRSIGLCYWNEERQRLFTSSLTTSFHIDGREYYLGRFFCDKIFGKPGEPLREELKKKQQDIYAVKEYEGLISWYKTHPNHVCLVHLHNDNVELRNLPLDYVQSVFVCHNYVDMMYKELNEKARLNYQLGFKVTRKLNSLREKYLMLYHKKI